MNRLSEYARTQRPLSRMAADLGRYMPSQIDDHINDTSIHRATFRQILAFTNPLVVTELSWFRADRNMSVTRLDVLARGATPAATANVRYKQDREAGLTVALRNVGCDAATGVGATYVTQDFDNPAIAVGQWVFCTLSGVSGTPTEVLLVLHLEEA